MSKLNIIVQVSADSKSKRTVVDWVTEVLTSCVVVIFRKKASFLSSIDRQLNSDLMLLTNWSRDANPFIAKVLKAGVL